MKTETTDEEIRNEAHSNPENENGWMCIGFEKGAKWMRSRSGLDAGWVSVEREKPKDPSVAVIGFVLETNQPEQVYYLININRWWNARGMEIHVTHWMPFPAFPLPTN